MLHRVLSVVLAIVVVGCDDSSPSTDGAAQARDGSIRNPNDGSAGTIDAWSPNSVGDAGRISPIDRVFNDTVLSDDAAGALFDGAPTASLPALPILYPLDHSAMPANVLSPTIQWEGGVQGDVLRVRLTRGPSTITAYLPLAAPFSYQAPQRDFSDLIASGGPGDLRIELTYHTASSGISTSSTVDVRIAEGRLYGSVYYWNLNNAETERLDAATGARDIPVPLLATPPPRIPFAERCMACHTVSRDGTKVHASNLTNSFAFDVSTTPGAYIFGVGPTAPITMEFASYSPDSRYLIGTQASEGSPSAVYQGILTPRGSSPLQLRDGVTGQSVATTLPTEDAIFAAWSPDGARVAYTNAAETTWNLNPTTSQLMLLDVDYSTTPPIFQRSRAWLNGASVSGAEMGEAIAHPTWAPDSEWLVFQHGPRMFSSTPAEVNRTPGFGEGERWPAALYLIARDSITPRRLTRASGVNAWWPSFSPFITAETVNGATHRFAWVLFFSRRDYGNGTAGTAGSNFRQLWISAIDLDDASEDPSFAPYWIPGQDRRAHNAAAYWAPEACRANGDQCESGAECCTGVCDSSGVCVPPSDGCIPAGERCGADSDCCGAPDVLCVGNICDVFLF